MTTKSNHWAKTRTTLIERLKDWRDDASWREFFDIYGRLIYHVAVKAGLRDSEAQDVLQETVIKAAKHLRDFRYDRQKGSFKSWLLTITRSQIIDHWRRASRDRCIPNSKPGTGSETDFIERQPDPASLQMDELWEQEWQRTLLAAATARVKQRVDPGHFQIFDCFVHKEWPIAAIAAKLDVKPEQVKVIKHRVSRKIKEEVRRLEQEGL